MNKNIIILIIGSLFLISACTQQVESAPTQDTPSVVEVPETVMHESAGETKTVKMIARQWEFDPETVTVNQGDKVRLEVTSVDVTHGIAIPEFGINVRLVEGATEVVEFTADRAGTFPFICSIPCGRGHSSMTGQIIVQ